MSLKDLPWLTLMISSIMLVFYVSSIRVALMLHDFKSYFLFHFSHSSVEHLLQNLFSLLFFGYYMEKSGRIRYLEVLFLSSLAGGILSVVLTSVPGMGMSAGIFGIMGYLMLSAGKMSFGSLPVPFLCFAYSVFNLLQAISGEAGISYVSHAIGFLSGMALFWVHEKRIPEIGKDIIILTIIINVAAAVVDVL